MIGCLLDDQLPCARSHQAWAETAVSAAWDGHPTLYPLREVGSVKIFIIAYKRLSFKQCQYFQKSSVTWCSFNTAWSTLRSENTWKSGLLLLFFSFLFCLNAFLHSCKGKCEVERTGRKGEDAVVTVMYLYLGKKVDPDPFGLQTARFFDPHTKVLHVCIDDILHCSAKWGQKYIYY